MIPVILAKKGEFGTRTSLLSFCGDSDEALRQICAALRVKPFVAEHAELESCAKPEEYRGFPYTDRPDRLVSLCRVLSGAGCVRWFLKCWNS